MKLPKESIILPVFILIMVTEYILMNYAFPDLIYEGENLFLTDLLGIPLKIPRHFLIIISLLDVLLIFKLGSLIHSKKIGLISAFLFCTSPWIIFLSFWGAISIFLLSIIMLQMIGFLNRNVSWGKNLFMVASLMIFASSVLLWPWVSTFIWYYWKKTKRISFYWIFILAVVVVSFINFNALKNIITGQITVFNDVGLLNTVNQFQGETKSNNLFFIGRIVENKYTYFLQHLVFNFMATISPVTYFSPQYRLLNFAFTSPIFIAMIIPLGLFIWRNGSIINFRNSFIILTLILPAVLVQSAPDLSKLVLVLPFLIIAISLGLANLLEDKSKIKKILLFFALFLFVFQGVISLADISIREPVRFTRNLEVK